MEGHIVDCHPRVVVERLGELGQHGGVGVLEEGGLQVVLGGEQNRHKRGELRLQVVDRVAGVQVVLLEQWVRQAHPRRVLPEQQLLQEVVELQQGG